MSPFSADDKCEWTLTGLRPKKSPLPRPVSLLSIPPKLSDGMRLLGQDQMLKRLLRSATLSSARRDFDQYLMALDGASTRELGSMVLVAQEARLWAERQGIGASVFLTPFSVPPSEVANAQAALLQARAMASTQGADTLGAGLAVWLYSLRAVALPELRIHGRRMWGILARGFPHARQIAREAGVSEDAARLGEEIDAVPTGLEPRDAAGVEVMPGVSGETIMTAREVDRQHAADRLERQKAEERAAAALTLEARIKAAVDRNSRRGEVSL